MNLTAFRVARAQAFAAMTADERAEYENHHVPDIEVEARRWSGGWELWINGDCETECERFEDAEQQVRDWLDAVDPENDHNGWEIFIVKTGSRAE